MRRILVGFLLWALLAPEEAAAQEDRSALEKSGDLLAIGIPIAALTTSLLKQDWQGSIQLVGSGVTTQVITETLKHSVGKWRPNAANTFSFPSGHSSGAWTGASFFGSRYGPAWGIPSYVLAAWVSYTRVHEQKHFLDDVASGASLALYSNWLWVTPYHKDVMATPSFSTNGIGLTFDIGGGEPRGLQGPDDDELDRFVARWSYTWAFGAADETKNTVQAPENVGTIIDVSRFDTTSNPTTTADFTLTRHFKRSDLYLQLIPYERRDFGSFPGAVNFNGVTFPANTPTRSAYRWYVLRAGWAWRIVDNENWWARVGAGAQFEDTTVSLTTQTQSTEVSDTVLYPYVHAAGAWRVFRKFGITAEATFATLGDYTFDVSAYFWWYPHPRWGLGIGYMYITRDIETTELVNVLELNRILFIISYSW